MSRETPPPAERVRAETAPVDQSRVIKRALKVGSRTILVDQFVGA